jgi:hypothetical protein
VGREFSSFPPSSHDKLYIGMRDDDETQSLLTNRVDDAFCARMRAAIGAGLESAPGVVTKPGTKNPKYVLTEPRLLGFSLVDIDV